MHCTARLYEMLNQYSDRLHKCDQSDQINNFLVEEIELLEEAKGIALPDFVPRKAFLVILQGKVKEISSIPIGFVEEVWSYIEDVVMSVLMRNTENYYQLQLHTKRACHNLITRMKERSVEWMMEIVEMESLTDYTCNPEYVSEWNRLMVQRQEFIKFVNWHPVKTRFSLEGIGELEVIEAFKQYPDRVLAQAFDLKTRMIAYWKVVLGRLVDCMALHLQLSVSKVVNKDIESEIVHELMGPNCGAGIEKMLEESPSVAGKREKLIKSIKKLRDSKEVVAKVMNMDGHVN